MTVAAARRAPARLRAVWLLTRLRLVRLLNQMTFIYSRRWGSKSRPASPGKGRNRWFLTGLVALAMLFSFGNLTRQGIVNLHRALDAPVQRVAAALTAKAPHHRAAAPLELKSGTFSAALTRGLTMQLALLLGVAVLISLGAREMVQPDWDLEWLATLPATMPTLLWSRLVERSVSNPFGLIALGPACVLVAWYSGYRWTALLAGAAAALGLLMLAALLRTLVDTGLRLSLAPSRLRNLQAMISIAGVLLMYLAMSTGMQGPSGIVFDLARQVPDWAVWTPPGLLVQAINAPEPSRAVALALLLAAEIGIALYAGVALLQYQLRNGVVAAGSRESVRGASVRRAVPRAAGTFLPGSVVQRRELTLLGRDRNFLVQSMVLPVIIVGSQWMLSGRLSAASFAAIGSTTLAWIAFLIAAYALMLSAFQTLNSEGAAVWILYTVPRPLAAVLQEKAQLWSAIALIYPVVLFAAAVALGHRADLEMIGLVAVVVLGVPIYSLIAVSLGVFASDPLAADARTRVRPTYAYLYMLLVALYTYAIFAGQWPQRLVLIVLSALLALALWQKAQDDLPYLLDPSAAPPARVSTADGLIAAMMFFVFQGLTALVVARGERELGGSQLIIVFSVAGALTYALVRYAYWRTKTKAVPAIFARGRSVASALLWGVGAGAVALLGVIAYLYVLQRLDALPQVLRQPAPALSAGPWLAVLAVVAAPLFEEFIFRGLIFGGLRRSITPARAAAASAALFAIVHPPASMIPVFVVGLCTAAVYQRSGMLLAPMVTHAVYNGALIAFYLQRT